MVPRADAGIRAATAAARGPAAGIRIPSRRSPSRSRPAAACVPRWPDERGQVAPFEELADRPDVVGADRQRLAEPGVVGRQELAVAGIGAGAVAGRLDDDAERFAPAARAVHLDEHEVVAAGEDADPLEGDELAADGAVDAVRERREAIARVHRRSVYCLVRRSASTAPDCGRIPPGGIIDRTPRVRAPHQNREATRATAHRPHGGRTTPEHFRHSYSKDKAGLVRRLSRMEGQVRGIARMIEREEYCVDILQQTAALRAAVDAVSVLVLEDHVQGCVRTAAERGEADQYVDEVIDVVRRTLGRPVRGSGRSA